MSAGLSRRAAARLAECTPRAIAVAIERGHLSQLADGTVTEAALAVWMRGRRAPRGGAHRRQPALVQVSTRIPARGVATSPAHEFLTDALPGSPAHGVPEIVANVATMLETGAADLAMVLARYVPLPLAQRVTEDWLLESLAGWVGSPGQATPEPMSAVAEWPAPTGGRSWSEHQLFAVEGLLRVDWMDAADEAAAWRAERGLPPL